MIFESTARRTVFFSTRITKFLLRLRGAKFKSYADYFIPPLLFARQHVGNLLGNARAFLARDFHMDSGMRYLIESFYRSIREGAPVPIPYREILLTARIMDAIFDQLRSPPAEYCLVPPRLRVPDNTLRSIIVMPRTEPADEPLISYARLWRRCCGALLPEPGQFRAYIQSDLDPGNLVLDSRIQGGFRLAQRGFWQLRRDHLMEGSLPTPLSSWYCSSAGWQF